MSMVLEVSTLAMSTLGDCFCPPLLVPEPRVDHSKAFVCTTCGWGFFVLGLFTFKG